MKIRAIIVYLLASIFLLAASPASSQCAKCNWADRGDRFEGVLNKPSAAGTCDFMGVQPKRANRIADKPKRLYLHFWLPSSETPVIEVWQHERVNYWMVPKTKRYSSGPQTFSWDCEEVIEPLGINSDKLYARVSNAERTLYFPALLSAEEKFVSARGYIFSFDCSAGVEVDVSILREEKGNRVVVRSFPYSRSYGGISNIEWDGKDEKGKEVPSGVYVFRLRGDILTETLRRINRNISFQHYGSTQ